MNGKIYCLRDMRNNEIRYVGFTRSTIKTRFSQHKHEALKRNTLSHVYNWFRSCKKDGILPTIELLEENIPLDKWGEKENYWINKFDNLTNQKSGGNGVHHNTNGSGRISSIDNKKKASLKMSSSSLLFVGVVGFELTTPWSQTRCANRTTLHPESLTSKSFSQTWCKVTHNI